MRYPKYIVSFDGYIGRFKCLDFDEFPVYRFAGGSRIADNIKIETGTDEYEIALKIASDRQN